VDDRDDQSVQDRAARLVRREPPAFRRVVVESVHDLSPRMRRVRVHGPELAGLEITEPAASVRVLLPSPGTEDLVMPTWNGNEFLLADGTRPVIRTFTPRRFDAAGPALDLDVVLHEGGAASAWAAAAAPGAEAAISGPGRGFEIDPSTPAYLLGGDESAIPAIGQLLEAIPPAIAVEVHIEVAVPDARQALPDHPGATVTWHDLPRGDAHGQALIAAMRRAPIDEGTHVWVAGEAAAVQAIRKHLFDERGVARAMATVRGYWKHGRTG
jgi:NADPH-dependent ferric siderophore reductase